MLPSTEFWREVHRDDGPGVLVALLLTSWKEIADNQGIRAVDFAAAVFEGVGSSAMASAPLLARTSLTTLTGYWRDRGAAREALDLLDTGFDLDVRTPAYRFSVAVQRVVLQRSAGQAGESVYLHLQARLAEVVERMPAAVRYPALSSSWAQVSEKDDEE